MIRRYSALLLAVALVTACGSGGSDGSGGEDASTDSGAPTACADIDLASPPDEPVTIRLGHGQASEENLWLLDVASDRTQYQDEWYVIEWNMFRGPDERLQTYQAGALDAVVMPTDVRVRGQATGALDLDVVATLMREGEPEAFSTAFIALEGAGITSTDDLAGTTMGIYDIGSHGDWLARVGAIQGGVDPEREIDFVVFPFPAQEEALRGGQVDVAITANAFYANAMNTGGVVDVFDAADVVPAPFDLLAVSFDRSFIDDNLGAVCAFRDDLVAMTAFYNGERDEALALLAASDYIGLPEEFYLQVQDYFRPDGAVYDVDGENMFIDALIEVGLLPEDERFDANELVRAGVTAGH